MSDTQKKDIEATVEGNGTLVLAFRHGEVLRIHPESLTPEIRHAALLHGLKQKLVDAAAISRDTATGRAATIVTKYDAVREIFDRITGENPSWNKPRVGGASGAGGLLARAIARYKSVPVEAAKAYLDRLTDAQKQALRVDPRIATIINDLRAESAKPAGIDTDALLGGLDDLGAGPDDDGDDDESAPM
jgi:hypothetical protein